MCFSPGFGWLNQWYIYIYIYHKLYIWLVVLTILKNISQWEGLCDILWKKNVPNHQPDIVKCWSHEFPLPFILQFPSSDLWTLPNSSAAKWRVPRSRWWRCWGDSGTPGLSVAGHHIYCCHFMGNIWSTAALNSPAKIGILWFYQLSMLACVISTLNCVGIWWYMMICL